MKNKIRTKSISKYNNVYEFQKLRGINQKLIAIRGLFTIFLYFLHLWKEKQISICDDNVGNLRYGISKSYSKSLVSICKYVLLFTEEYGKITSFNSSLVSFSWMMKKGKKNKK